MSKIQAENDDSFFRDLLRNYCENDNFEKKLYF